MSEALSRPRVAELIVTYADGRRRGSGYRVTAEAVLTAAHVVEGALSVQVRFEPDLPGEWCTTAVSWWAEPEVDVAVVSIPSRPGEQPVSPARFGRIGDRAAVLAVQAVGFPRWKMRTDDGTISAAGDGRARYRDAHHAVGSV
ncbi:MAG: serine protease, partial [Actinobacteria bacterium]|nr:serine protease [Actinomycetota bacterium]